MKYDEDWTRVPAGTPDGRKSLLDAARHAVAGRGQGSARRCCVVDLNHLNLRVRDAVACRDFYERHFGFRPAFEADGGFFIRNDDGFLLALIPAEEHRALPPGFHIGFGLDDADAVGRLHVALSDAGVRVTEVQDFRPAEAYTTFRCWDPDGTEVEVFWESDGS